MAMAMAIMILKAFLRAAKKCIFRGRTLFLESLISCQSSFWSLALSHSFFFSACRNSQYFISWLSSCQKVTSPGDLRDRESCSCTWWDENGQKACKNAQSGPIRACYLKPSGFWEFQTSHFHNAVVRVITIDLVRWRWQLGLFLWGNQVDGRKNRCHAGGWGPKHFTGESLDAIKLTSSSPPNETPRDLLAFPTFWLVAFGMVITLLAFSGLFCGPTICCHPLVKYVPVQCTQLNLLLGGHHSEDWLRIKN